MIIWTNGCFDLLHLGHIDLLWYAKLYNTNEYDLNKYNVNKLIVGIDSDERIKKMKGNDRPILDYRTRAKIISNLKMVDRVVVFDSDNDLRNFIKLFEVDYIIIGDHYKDKNVIGSEFAKHGVIFYPIKNSMSTTNIINKIRQI